MRRNEISTYSKLLLLTVAFSLLFLSACSKRYDDLPAFIAYPFNDSYNYSVGRFKTSYLADQIHAYYRGNTAAPIAVATFVDIDNLYGSSTFGRFFSEQLMSELSMRGYNVIEVRQSEALQVRYDQGELALSRDISTLRNSQDISGMVVGTYTVSPLRVYINARLIDPASSMVVSAGSVEMEKTGEINRLLRSSTLPPSLERIPVRHLGYSLPASAQYQNYFAPPSIYSSPGYFKDSKVGVPTEQSKAPAMELPKSAAPKLPEVDMGS